MLIVVPEHRPADLAAWREIERGDLAWPTSRLRRLVREAMAALADFAREPCYAGVSWGKDSVVTAHLVTALAAEGGPVVPLVWFRAETRENPWCHLVRNAFFAERTHPYHEVTARRSDRANGRTGTIEDGARQARELFGTDRYVYGLRGDESGGRGRRIRQGLTLGRSCAPIGRWTARDVFAYLAREGLPVHPAYAMSWGGTLDRDRIRVASVGGERGTGFGRAEWERAYYPSQ